MSWNVWNSPLGSFMIDMGISSNIMKSPSPKCYMILWDMTIYIQWYPNWSDITPICVFITERDLLTVFDLITNFGCFHRTGAASQQRKFTPSGTWSCLIWDLHLFLCCDHYFLNFLRTFGVSNIPWFFYFAYHHFPCATAGGQIVPEGTIRVVIVYEMPKK